MGRFLEGLLGLREPGAVHLAFGNMRRAHPVELLPIGQNLAWRALASGEKSRLARPVISCFGGVVSEVRRPPNKARTVRYRTVRSQVHHENGIADIRRNRNRIDFRQMVWMDRQRRGFDISFEMAEYSASVAARQHFHAARLDCCVHQRHPAGRYQMFVCTSVKISRILVPGDLSLGSKREFRPDPIDPRCDYFRTDELLHDIQDFRAGDESKDSLARMAATVYRGQDQGRLFKQSGRPLENFEVPVQLIDLSFGVQSVCLLVNHFINLVQKAVYMFFLG